MATMLVRIAAAICLASGVATLGAAAGALTLDGALAAAMVGTLIFVGGGLPWATVLLLFFLPSSGLSRVKAALRAQEQRISAKSDRRDAAQVLANGGVPSLFALLNLLHPSALWPLGFAGAVAAATADTWGTEIGAFSSSSPVLITSGRRVAPGTSGGITRLGSFGAATGSIFIALASVVALGVSLSAGLAIAAAGIAGSGADSLLGATLQEKRYCSTCLAATEQAIHRRCGTPTAVISGIPGLNNDIVNALACATGAIVVLTIASMWSDT